MKYKCLGSIVANTREDFGLPPEPVMGEARPQNATGVKSSAGTLNQHKLHFTISSSSSSWVLIVQSTKKAYKVSIIVILMYIASHITVDPHSLWL